MFKMLLVPMIMMLMVDLDLVEVRVGDVVEHLFPVDWTIEGIAHWVRVNVLHTRPDHWYGRVGLVRQLLADHHVELIGHPTARSHW
jgi:hypothetical protein